MIILFCIIYHNLLIGKEIFTHDAIKWYGKFHYYLEGIVNGHFPFWDPYIITGTPFYPNINDYGLDPLVFVSVLLVKVCGIAPLTSFIYLRLLDLAVFAVGAFYLFKYITGCRTSALVASGILFFSVAPTSFRQSGVIIPVFLTAFLLYFVLLFFDNIKNQKRYLYLFCLVLVTGISMNMGIPAYFLFNLSVFLVIVFAIRIVNLGEIRSALSDKKLLAFLLPSTILLIALGGPLLALYQDSKGELFPSVRIIQKNGYFKKLMASEVGDSVLSEKFTKQLGVYNSYGNALNLIYPDMHKTLFGRRDFFSYHHLMAETLLYIGMVPFVFCIIGFIYSKSRYRYLALVMLILIFINMFSFNSIVAQPNPIQEVFHTIFPPLKMIDVKEVFSSFFLLYMTVLLSLGLKILFNEREWQELIKGKYLHIITICLVILLAKFLVTGYFWEKWFFTTPPDLFAVVLLLLFIVLIYQYSRALVQERLLYGLILFLMFADIASYNIQIKPYVLQRNVLGPVLDEQPPIGVNLRFEYFRIPFLETSVAFGETLFKTKGAISRGNDHHIFTTKRYYDYLTHVPLENQFILSGCVYPILRFFPNDRVKVFEDKKGLLNYFAWADDPWTLGQYLHVEKEEEEDTDHIEQKGIQNIDQSEDVLWLRKDHVTAAYAEFLNREEKRLKEIRENLDRYLDTPGYKLTIKEFSPNEVTILVNNNIDGYLYYNDGWSKYWKAYDGDIEVPIKIANYNFKAVFLEEGEHVIRFVYNPGHYKLGLIAYYIGILLCLFLIAFPFVRERLTIIHRY